MSHAVRTAGFAALAATLLSTPANAAEIQIAVNNPVIELTLTEIVQSQPDTAQVGAGVTVRADRERGAASERGADGQGDRAPPPARYSA